MKGRCAFLAVLLVVSGVIAGMVGLVMRYAVLAPRGIDLQAPVVAIPFLVLRDGLLQETQPEERAVDRVLFISDPGLCPEDGEAVADHFCQTGMTVFDVGTRRIASETFQDSSLMELLYQRTYGYVLIGLGSDTSGYPVPSVARGYQSLVEVVRAAQPQAEIGVCAVPGQPDINEQLRQIAQEHGIRYLEDMER